MVEVRQGTLTWIAVEQEEDEEDEEEEEAGGGRRRKEAEGGRRRKEEANDIKSNNPHLAGGEIEKSLAERPSFLTLSSSKP